METAVELLTQASDLQFTQGKKREAYAIYKKIIEQYPDYSQRAFVQQMMHKIEKEGVLLSPEEEIAANQNKIIMEDTRRNAIQRLKSDLIIKITGVRGRSICIYPYKCVINTSITAGSVLTGNAIDGEKTIYFKDVIGIQYKKPGKLIGYLQFETAAMTMNNEKSNFFNENTFTFDKGTEEVTQAAYEYVIGRMDALKAIE